MSDNGVPDLGGLSNEETFFADEVCQIVFPFCVLVCVGFVMTFAHLLLTGMLLLSQVQQTSLVYPGAYRKVSVELKVINFLLNSFFYYIWIFFLSNLTCIVQIHHLAVNALLKSNLVSEMEGGDFLGFEQDGNSRGSSSNVNASFDETTGCAPAFRVLKQLIHSCLTDVCKSRNIYADSILQRLSWWLCRYDYVTSCTYSLYSQLVKYQLISDFIL